MARIRSSLVTGLSAVMGSDEFVVVELTNDGPKPVYDHRGELLKFSSGEAASASARAMTVSGRKFQPRRVKDDAWQDREKSRFATKEYKPLPWHDAVWWKAHRNIHGDHFPHVSQKNSVGLMAFTESDDKGSADLQTALKPGKYLERYFSDLLDPYIIRDLCTTFSNVFEDNCLLFADSEDDFELLYTTGPSSCMSHPKDKFTSHIHPVRVYAAGDLALVYMKRDGRIVARALCWPEKKTYSRIYGDGGRIEPLLAKDGYKKGVPFGARLQRVYTWENKKAKSGNRAFVAPHIDDVNHLMDYGDHLLIGGGGSMPKGGKTIKLVGAAGVTEWVSLHCRCGKETTAGDLLAVFTDSEGKAEKWCKECRDIGAFKCKATGRLATNDQAVEMHDGSKWWTRTFLDQGFVCKGSGLNYSRGEAMSIKDGKGGVMLVSASWYKANKGKPCGTCGGNIVGDCNATCKDKYAQQQRKMSDLRGNTSLFGSGGGGTAQGYTTVQTIDWGVGASAWPNIEQQRRR